MLFILLLQCSLPSEELGLSNVKKTLNMIHTCHLIIALAISFILINR